VYSTLASGRPVLVSARADSEIACLVTRAGCGRAVEPENGPAYAEAVLAAYRDRATLPEEGRRGRALMEEHYSKQAIGQRYDALIGQLCAG
jgi:glycosyltransferase involved in cell wall biosynthesis